jgi:hypothetical protein
MFKKNILLFGVIAVFACPILIAKLVLSQQWGVEPTLNKGQFFNKQLNFLQFKESFFLQKGWQIAYVVPMDCQAACQHQVKLLKNAWMALGRQQNRVHLLLLANTALPSIEDSLLTTLRVSHQTYTYLRPYSLMILDPLGNFILHYKQADSIDAQLQINRSLMFDLHRLLKYSKVG